MCRRAFRPLARFVFGRRGVVDSHRGKSVSVDCVQVRAASGSGRRIDRVLNASELHFAGTIDRHHIGGWILCVYLQHKAPDLFASLDGRLDRFRASLSGPGVGSGKAVERARKRAGSLAIHALRLALFSGCANLFAAKTLENTCTYCGRLAGALGRGQRSQGVCPFRSHPGLDAVRGRGGGVLARKPATGNVGGPPFGRLLRFVGSSMGLPPFPEWLA